MSVSSWRGWGVRVFSLSVSRSRSLRQQRFSFFGHTTRWTSSRPSSLPYGWRASPRPSRRLVIVSWAPWSGRDLAAVGVDVRDTRATSGDEQRGQGADVVEGVDLAHRVRDLARVRVAQDRRGEGYELARDLVAGCGAQRVAANHGRRLLERAPVAEPRVGQRR